MTKNIYALLVGIDNYDPASVPSIPTLKGCVNDIKARVGAGFSHLSDDQLVYRLNPPVQEWGVEHLGEGDRGIVHLWRFFRSPT